MKNNKTSKYFCIKCGSRIHYVSSLCEECSKKRKQEKHDFENNHKYYDPKRNIVCHIGYDESDIYKYPEKGCYGRHYIMRRLDTGEIIETDNLWFDTIKNCGKNFPQIEFVYVEPKPVWCFDPFRILI